MNDHWDKLQKEKIDVRKIIQEDDRFVSKIEKKINNIKAAINEPDVYNTNLASRDRMDKVEFSVEGGGCSGMNYDLKFTNREPNDRDQIIYFANGSMKLLVPFASYVYVSDTQIDWSDDLLNGGFKFTNPQANRTCGCGTSFSV